MQLKVWMCNTNVDERTLTTDYVNARSLGLVVAPSEYGGFEYNFEQYCDDDEDILKVLDVCLFYNDRSPEQIADIRAKVRELIQSAPRHATQKGN